MMAGSHMARIANFLLNVGPNRQGRIVESSLKVLEKSRRPWRSSEIRSFNRRCLK